MASLSSGVMSGDPTCVFEVDRDLVLALESAYGPPIDSYLNGWQVWLEPSELEDAEGEPIVLEHRLHPPTGFRQPAGLSHHDLWDEVVTQLADGRDVLRLGEEERRLADVWRLLEVYPAHGDPVVPEELRAAAEGAIRRPAFAAGQVDHAGLGARWKRSKGAFDLPGALLDELGVG
jgi:hypothetical protein